MVGKVKVGEGVMVGVSVIVGVRDWVGVDVLVGVRVAVGVSVAVGDGVGVALGVRVGEEDGDGVPVEEASGELRSTPQEARRLAMIEIMKEIYKRRCMGPQGTIIRRSLEKVNPG